MQLARRALASLARAASILLALAAPASAAAQGAAPAATVPGVRPASVPAATNGAPGEAPAAASSAGSPPAAVALPLALQARLLAGLDLDAPEVAPALRRSAAVVAHQRAMNAAWARFRSTRLEAIRAFGIRELGAFPRGGRLYYPFSGPDVVHALALFPSAAEIVMTGLEPLGRPRDPASLDEEQRQQLLYELRDSLNVLLGVGFFRTEDMREDYTRSGTLGVLPVLLALLARMDAVPVSLVRGCLRADGGLQAGAATAECIETVRIDYRLGADAGERRLFYVSTDLSNAGLVRTPMYVAWAGRPADATLLKAASYLMYRPQFSTIRDLILTHSRMVVQDDSGIPWARFDPAQWSAALYGRYDRPIPLFAERRQPDLKRAYDGGARPLEFGIGYRHQAGDSNLQVFARR